MKMREIKFRAWDTFQGKMIKVNRINFDESEIDVVIQEKPTEKFYSCKFQEISLMQSTGLHDKNGAEIYEGDIVKCTDEEGEISKLNSGTGIGQVEWLNKWGFWNISVIENSLGDILFNGNVEVIGNIFNNPELLESEE